MAGNVCAPWSLFVQDCSNCLSLCYSASFVRQFFAVEMPPKKRSARQAPAPALTPAIRPNKRARRARLRPEDHDARITSPEPPIAAEELPAQGSVSVDVGVITSTISAVISQAIRTAFSPENLASIIGTNAQPQQPAVAQPAPRLVDRAVEDDVSALTMNTSSQSGTEGVFNLVNTDINGPRPQSMFTSISVPLASRVSPKIKARIWANEYINFGTLLSDSPQNEGKYSLSMSPSEVPSSQPQLTLEPSYASKRITNISQWVSAFTIFVSVYSEKNY